MDEPLDSTSFAWDESMRFSKILSFVPFGLNSREIQNFPLSRDFPNFLFQAMRGRGAAIKTGFFAGSEAFLLPAPAGSQVQEEEEEDKANTSYPRIAGFSQSFGSGSFH